MSGVQEQTTPFTQNQSSSLPSQANFTSQQSSAHAVADEYDYIAKIKSLSDNIEPEFYKRYFGDHFPSRDYQTSTRFIVDGQVIHTMPAMPTMPMRSSEVLWSQDNIKLIRNTLKPPHGAPKRPSVIVVECLDESTMGKLGTCLDISPSFFARFLGTYDTRSQGCQALTTLEARFDQSLK